MYSNTYQYMSLYACTGQYRSVHAISHAITCQYIPCTYRYIPCTYQYRLFLVLAYCYYKHTLHFCTLLVFYGVVTFQSTTCVVSMDASSSDLLTCGPVTFTSAPFCPRCQNTIYPWPLTYIWQ